MADTLTDGRRMPFAWFDKSIVDTYGKQLGVNALSVYMLLISYANREQQCFPSLRFIADKFQISRTTVVKALADLEAAGLISITHRRNPKGDATSNLYTILGAVGGSVREPPSRGGGSAGEPQVVQQVNQGGSPDGHEQEVINKKEFNKKDATDAQRPSRERAPKPKDERLNHPIIVAYRDVCRVTPNDVQRGEMLAAVADVDAWRAVLTEWMGRGWRPGNVTGQIEKYLQLHPKPTPTQKYTYVEQPDGSMKKIPVDA